MSLQKIGKTAPYVKARESASLELRGDQQCIVDSLSKTPLLSDSDGVRLSAEKALRCVGGVL